MNNVIKKIIDAKCTSSWFFLYENFFVIISCNKKKLNIGNNKEIDKAKICESVFIILDKLLDGINPPEETEVNDRLKESKSLIPAKLYKKIIKIVENK